MVASCGEDSLQYAPNLKDTKRVGLRHKRKECFPASANPIRCTLPPSSSLSTSSWHGSGSTTHKAMTQTEAMQHENFNDQNSSNATRGRRDNQQKDGGANYHGRRLSISSMLMDSALFSLHHPSDAPIYPATFASPSLESSKEQYQEEQSQSSVSTTQRFMSWHSKSLVKKIIPTKVKKLVGAGSNSNGRRRSLLSSSWHGKVSKQTDSFGANSDRAAVTKEWGTRKEDDAPSDFLLEITEEHGCNSIPSRKPKSFLSKFLSPLSLRKKMSKTKGKCDRPPCEAVVNEFREHNYPYISNKSWHGSYEKQEESILPLEASRRSSLPSISPAASFSDQEWVPSFRPEVSDILVYNDKENVSSVWKHQLFTSSSEESNTPMKKTSCLKRTPPTLPRKSSLRRSSLSSDDLSSSPSCRGRKGQNSYENSSSSQSKQLIRGVSWHGHPSEANNENIRRLLEQEDHASPGKIRPRQSQTSFSSIDHLNALASPNLAISSSELDTTKEGMSTSSRWKMNSENLSDPPVLPFLPSELDTSSKHVMSPREESLSLCRQNKVSSANYQLSQEDSLQPISPKSVDLFDEYTTGDWEMEGAITGIRIDEEQDYTTPACEQRINRCLASVFEENKDVDKWNEEGIVAQSENLSRLFVVMLHVARRKFELVQILSPLKEDTVADVLLTASESCETPLLRSQSYRSLYRLNGDIELKRSRVPIGNVASGWKVSDGETLIAIPSGHTCDECLMLSRSVLRNPEIAALTSNIKQL